MTANPRRDAWSAIRGFYYQIQLTVQRWLELGPHDELFCERGEDIEIISGALGNAPTVEQLLEQVKVRRSISLRSSESVSAVTRFFEARQLGARPTLFRFVTTGKASKEQGANFPRNLPGLVAWNAAKSRELDNAEIVRVAQQAKQLLRDAPRPTDITEKLESKTDEILGLVSTSLQGTLTER